MDHGSPIPPRLIGVDGRPLRASAMVNDGSIHRGASRVDRELYSWDAVLRSPDGALLREMPTLVARTEDVVRNSGLNSGAVQLYLDTVIGSGLRLSAKPDWRALGQTAEWAAAWGRIKEARFRLWAYDIDGQSDVGRRLSLAGRLGQACRSLLLKGQSFAVAEWRPDRRYATCIRMVNPDRVENPEGQADTEYLRRGIAMDQDGAPASYWIRDGHPTDYQFGARKATWRNVPAYTDWGRRRVLHVYDQELAGQSHGKSPFVALLKRLKKLDRWEDVTLESAIINAMFAATIESDLASAVDAIGGNDSLTEYLGMVAEWQTGKAVEFDGARIPHLFPGEKLNLNRPEQPTANFSAFEDAFNRHFAAGLGMSAEQYTKDYSQTNYSGARAGLADAWRTFDSKRNLIGRSQATQEYALWLEEDMDRHPEEIPPGAPDFADAKTAWCGCAWIGPGRGSIDALKDAKGTALELEYGATTLEQWCAEQGRDWEEVMEQRALELRRQAELEKLHNIRFESDARTAAMGAPTDSGEAA